VVAAKGSYLIHFSVDSLHWNTSRTSSSTQRGPISGICTTSAVFNGMPLRSASTDQLDGTK